MSLKQTSGFDTITFADDAFGPPSPTALRQRPLQRGVDVNDIVNMAAIAVLDAQELAR